MQPHGEVRSLSARVRRIVAPNPGPMTGPGTNTYVVGETDLVVVDPGPAAPSHVEAILDCVGDQLKFIACTHTHPDHSPAAARLAEATGATLIGRVTADDRHQDLTFQPAAQIEDDDCIAGDGWTLRAIRTPGHVDNHVCFLLEEESMVFAGDVADVEVLFSHAFLAVGLLVEPYHLRAVGAALDHAPAALAVGRL